MRIKLFLMLTILFVFAVSASAQGGPPPMPDLGEGVVIAEGLNGPQGLYVDSEGSVYVIDSGLGGEETTEFFNPNTGEIVPSTYGNTTRIVKISMDGEQEVIAMLPSVAVGEGEDFIGGARLTESDGTLYATVGAWIIGQGEEVTVPFYSQVVAITDGEAETVADLWAFELENNPDETINVESHPYGITAGPDGMLYVTEAAGNALVSVDPESGEVTLVAAFDPLPGVFPNPLRNNELLADPVPTNVAFDDEGNLFVSLLSGAPFVPGTAKVVQVSEDGEVTDFATGLTMLTDLKLGPDGNLYATSFNVFAQEGPVFNSGSVIRILEDGTAEVVVAGLPFVTAVAFDADGNGYVAINGAAIPGIGMVVRYDGLTEMEGQPLPEMGA
ncbi:MAG: hypothetical protein OHK0046_16200 [Anaerolineae bacterium]